MTTKEQRKIRRNINNTLADDQHEDSLFIADHLVDINVITNLQVYYPLFFNRNYREIIQAIYTLVNVNIKVRNINIAVQRASKVVFALKKFSRQNSTDSDSMIKSQISQTLYTILTLYNNQIKQGVELSLNIEELEPIYCYEDELNQVWTNLIHNAIQAMDSEGLLTINHYKENDFQVVEIKDNGTGIKPEIIDKIFTPFFTTKPAGEGSGLGLDIVKRIIDKHHGKISVRSELGDGSSFIVKIPGIQSKDIR